MKTKSILLFVATLIIGFIIGFLTNGQLTRQKFQHFVKQGSSESFKGRILGLIHPDELQIKDIEPILEKYAAKVRANVDRSKNELRSLHKELIEELTPYLHQSQIDNLKESHQRFERRWDSGHRPPPPGDMSRQRRD